MAYTQAPPEALALFEACRRQPVPIEELRKLLGSPDEAPARLKLIEPTKVRARSRDTRARGAIWHLTAPPFS